MESIASQSAIKARNQRRQRRRSNEKPDTTGLAIVGGIFMAVGLLVVVISLFALVSSMGRFNTSAGVIGAIASVVFLAIGVLNIAAPWGVMKRKIWAWYVFFTLCCISVVNFPIGTVLGIWGISQLTSHKEYLCRKGKYENGRTTDDDGDFDLEKFQNAK